MSNAPERVYSSSGRDVGVYSTKKTWESDVEYIRADLASAPQPQPIESAPKDGRLIWVLVHGEWKVGRKQASGLHKKAVYLPEDACYTYDATLWSPLIPPGTQPQGCSKCEEMWKAVREYFDAKEAEDAAYQDYINIGNDAALSRLNEAVERSEKADAALSTLKKQEEQS